MTTSENADRLPVVLDTPEFETQLVSSLISVFTDEQITPKSGHRRTYPPKGKARIADTKRRYKAVMAVSSSGVRKAGASLKANLKEARFVPVTLERFKEVVHLAVKRAVVDSGPGIVFDRAVFELAEVIGRALPKARHQRSELAIEKLVDAFVETHDPIAKVSAEIDAGNARARVRFMSNFHTLTSDEVTEASGSTAKNRSQTASRWKAEGKIFSLLWQGQERYLAFQFKDGRPRPVIGQLLAALPDRWSSWEIAFWLVSTNSWLDGAAPRAVLDDAERLLYAARQETEAIVG